MSEMIKSEEAMARAHQMLTNQIDNVQQAGTTAQSILQELQHGYISQSGAAFQVKVEDWCARYTRVKAAFEHLMEATDAANKTITNADQDGAGYVQHSVSSTVDSVLTPSR